MATARGGILYDASRLRKPADEMFEVDYWKARNALREVTGGRASIAILETDDQRWVLRHYRRGGAVARLSQDRYVWAGAARTRSFREWRLLAELQRRALPAPAPIAARFVRSGFTYRADLITAYLPNTHTLAQALAAQALEEGVWRQVGATIARFHAAGVHHPDLNAHNVLLDAAAPAELVYVLDFDRGRLRARGAWEQQVLARLQRSLEKIKRTSPQLAYGEREWRWLLEGYRAC